MQLRPFSVEELAQVPSGVEAFGPTAARLGFSAQPQQAKRGHSLAFKAFSCMCENAIEMKAKTAAIKEQLKAEGFEANTTHNNKTSGLSVWMKKGFGAVSILKEPGNLIKLIFTPAKQTPTSI
jgi:hypothetical protein